MTSTNTIHLDILTSLNNSTLDYKWQIRKFLSGLDSDKLNKLQHQLYQSIANSSFNQLSVLQSTHTLTPSLRAILSMCTNLSMTTNVDAEDDKVTFLSHLFNDIVKSTRGLHKCYDCGTTARAVFLTLINVHRGSYDLSEPEKQRMMTMYKTRDEDTEHGLKMLQSLRNVLNDMDNVICICSISLRKKTGHVWVIEKHNNVTRVYQSALRSHLTIDYIEHMGYLEDPNRGIEMDMFLDNVEDILNSTEWNDTVALKYHQNFAYHPKSMDIDNTLRTTFCYTFINVL